MNYFQPFEKEMIAHNLFWKRKEKEHLPSHDHDEVVPKPEKIFVTDYMAKALSIKNQ